MSRSTSHRFGHEQELQRSFREPVSIWRKEWVVPSAIERPVAPGQSMAERLGSDADAMRSSTPIRILKWVRTSDVAQHESEDLPHMDEGSSALEPVEAAKTPQATDLSGTPEVQPKQESDPLDTTANDDELAPPA